MLTVEIIIRNAQGEIVATVQGNAHESLRWPARTDLPILDLDEGLMLYRIFYDADSRPLPRVDVRPAVDRRKRA